MEPSYTRVLRTLHNPIYAGVYVFGKTRTVRELDPENSHRLRVRRTPNAACPILIWDHHPAYLSVERFQKNQALLRGNSMRAQGGSENGSGPAREGSALLQGLVRCGQCGRLMSVSYGGYRNERSGRTQQYRCKALRDNLGGKDCQVVGGKRIDLLVVSLFLEVTRPAGVEAAQEAAAQVGRESEAIERSWDLRIEQAEYDAQRAERQFHAVEPENRLVGRELERRWNERLRGLEEVLGQRGAVRERAEILSAAELERAGRLGEDLGAVWRAETTSHRDRKRLLRCLIEEVQVRTEEKSYAVRVVWKGGAIIDREVVRHRGGAGQATSEETVDLVRRLAEEFDDAQIARILSKQGRQSGRGLVFTATSVLSLRGQHGIRKAAHPAAQDPREGPFTADEAARELGVCMSTIHRWLREGVLAGRQVTAGAPWRIVLNEEVRQRLRCGEAPVGWVGLTEASRRLGLSKPRVTYLVKTGKLEAVHTTVGKRRCWRIDVRTTSCGAQEDMFDQLSNGTFMEA